MVPRVLVPLFFACCMQQACIRHHATPIDSVVPDVPPDSTSRMTWARLTRPDNVLDHPRGVAGRIVRNTMYVRFADAAAAVEKAAALDEVHGHVVGGMRLGQAAFYHIELDLPADAGVQALLDAKARLSARVSVRMVLLDLLDPVPTP